MEGARWLIAIAAAALAFGFDAIKDHVRGAALFLFCAASVAFSAAVASGLVYTWWSYAYAGLRESGVARDNIKVRRTKRRSDAAFHILLWGFGAGMLLFAGFGASLLVELRRAAPDFSMVATASPAGPMLVLQHEGRFWILQRDAKGFAWAPLPRPGPRREGEP